MTTAQEKITNIFHNKYVQKVPFILLFLLAIHFKFVNLGYSDYQGDEGKAMYSPSITNIGQYLMEQRKGPLQFLTTYTYSLFDQDYSNYFLARFPFALASLLSVFFFYKTAKLFFGVRAAYIGTLLFILNGLFIAFGRIVQYQSYVILFSILAVYFFALMHFDSKWKVAGLYYGALFWALGLLAHYDAVFIFPIALYLVGSWIKTNQNIKFTLKHLILASILPALLCGAFYIPYVLNLSDSTSKYWATRISGGDEKISSSIYTFVLYNQYFVLYAYMFFFGLFTVFAAINFNSKKFMMNIFAFVLWVLVPFVFMEFFVNVPGTHFYTYLIPLLMLFGAGIAFITNIQRANLIIIPVFVAFFVLHIVVQHLIFVDNSKVYPWEDESLGIIKFERPNKDYHLSLFGYPYQAYWKDVSAYLAQQPIKDTFSSSEKDSVTDIYIKGYKYTKDLSMYYVYVPSKQKIPGDISSEIKARLQTDKPIISYNRCTLLDSWNKGFTQFVKEQVFGFANPVGCTGPIAVQIYKFR